MITTSSSNPDKKILLDADVISHLIKGDLFGLLGKLYPGRLLILDIVKAEIYQRKGWDILIEKLIGDHNIQEVLFPEEAEYKKEFAHLISPFGLGLGRGESACMIYCRFNKDILASSNLRDIHRYCSLHKIEYLTTADIIFEAYSKGLLSESDGNHFIINLKAKNSKFPFDTMQDMIKSFNRFTTR